jgi:FkbM family methyltransferase
MLILIKNLVFRIVGRDFSQYLRIKYAIFYLAAKFKMYESVEMSLLKKFVKKGDFVIDGGANLGIYTHRFVNLVGDEGSVLAFEPLPFLCEFLDQHIKSKRVQIAPKALSDLNQKMKIWIPYIGSGLLEPALASLQETASRSEQLIVETVRLDDQVKENKCVNYIKMDLEGHEMMALRGAERILQNNRPVVQFEENNMVGNLENWQVYANSINYRLFKIDSKRRKSGTNYYLLPKERVNDLRENSLIGFRVLDMSN